MYCRILTSLVCVLLFVINPLTIFAQSSESWKPLIEGDNLSNFEVLNGTAKFSLENTIIIGVSTFDTPNTFLCTKEIYSDFILEFEVWADSTLNSGVQFRSNSDVNIMDGRVHGYQVEIESSDRKWAGGIYEEGKRGWLYPLEQHPKGQNAFRRNEWNHYRIEAIGNEIKTWVNGIQCAHLIDDQTKEGFIGLQVHSIENPELSNKLIKWKNLRISTENLEANRKRTSGETPIIDLTKD